MKYIQCVNNGNKNATPLETISAIKNAGFDGVFLQWYNKNMEVSQEEQLEYCKKLGLEIQFCHLGYKGINSIWEEGETGDLLVEGYLRDLDAMQKYGVLMVVMHLTSKNEAPPPSLVGLERLRKIIEYAKDKGIKIAFENTKIFGYLEYVFDNLAFENMGVCFDSGHCHCHFNDKFSWNKFKDKIFALHLHDNDKSDDLHLVIGDGTIDWKDYASKLKSANYNGPITLESCYRCDYLNMSLDEFYSLTLNRAKNLFE